MRKGWFDKIATGWTPSEIKEAKDEKSEVKSESKDTDEAKDEKSDEAKSEDPKGDKPEDKPEDKKPEDKTEEPKKEDGKSDKKDEPKSEEAPQAAPQTTTTATKGYNGVGNVTGMSQTSHTVNNIKEQTVHNHYHGSFHDFVKETCDQPVKRSQLKTLDSNQLEAISNVPDLNKFNFVNEEDQVKNAYKEFAAAIIQRCPKLFNELVREHISGAIERDKDLFKFIYDANEKKHRVERRYVAKKPEYDEGPMTEERAKQFVAERRKAIAEISSEEAAAKVEEKEFIIPKWVEINLDTGSQEILSDEAAAPYEKEWARSHNTVAPTKPEGKKKATKKPKEPEGEG
ncbi:hypothetical protein IKG73_02810 [Candidatus Saccharibacteria bacterium]|nr:hypothetical protein [Candidatus Saccharibacteria bacterium]